jgi:phosphatidylglycerophosphatase A
LILILLIQFFLFRIYDIIKPTPARQAESLPHGWGIVTDDLLAGVYANLTGQIIIRFILPLLGMGMNG